MYGEKMVVWTDLETGQKSWTENSTICLLFFWLDLSKETGMYAQDVAGVLIELKILKPVEDIVSEETLEERKQGKVKTHPTSWYVDMNAPRLTEFAKAVHEGTLPTKIVLDERNFLHAPKKQITEPDG